MTDQAPPAAVQADEALIPIGISSCLLGEPVRFDTGHKRDNYIIGTLGQYFRFESFCPEMAIGLGAPRPTIRLVGDPEHPRVIGVKQPDIDVTDKLHAYGRETASRLGHLRGYIFKRDSPSCGMERVKVYTDKGMPGGRGAGAYAQEIMAALPLLPVEEEGRLGDPVLRENFIQRVFVYDRWQRLIEAGLTPGALVDFHTRHKFILLAHDEPTYREIGHWIADAGKTDINALGERYISALMTALKKKASRKRHTNVLMHLMGFLKQNLDADDKAELVETIEAYRQEQVPLVVPITLLRHHFRRHPDPYVQDQYYLDPHPRELKLRNML